MTEERIGEESPQIEEQPADLHIKATPRVEGEAAEIEQKPPPPPCSCISPSQPMAAWVGGGSEAECRPCILGPVVQWYAGELRQQGHEDKAQRIEQAAQGQDPLQLCAEFDNIKGEVEDPLRERLCDFDCAVQAYDPQADLEQQESTD